MQSKDPQFPIRIGRVSIQKRADGYLRLRLEIDKTEYVISFGSYSLERLEAAKNKVREIEADIYKERFDPSLEKYRLKPKQPSPISNSVIVPTQKELNIKEVWDFYCAAKEGTAANATKNKIWKNTEKILDRGNKLLDLNQTIPLIVSAREIYADGTIVKALNLLRAACNMAIEAKKISYNPYTDKVWELLDLSTEDGDYTRKSFSREEISKILLAFESNCFVKTGSRYQHSYYANYVRFRSLTGCRPEESIALTWDDYKEKGGKKYIIFSKAYSHRQLRKTKTGKTRIFPCNDQLIELMESIPKRDNPKGLIFPNREEGYISGENFSRRYWQPIVTELVTQGEVSQYLPFYNLRHSFITELVRSGIDMATIAAWSGNSEPTILKHYLAVNHELIPPIL
jgi:integrase